MKKRIISSIMCLAMLLSLLPVSAFAVGESATATGNINVTTEGVASGEIVVVLTSGVFDNSAADEDTFTVKIGETGLTIDSATISDPEEGTNYTQATLEVSGTIADTTGNVSVEIDSAAITDATDSVTATASTVTVTSVYTISGTVDAGDTGVTLTGITVNLYANTDTDYEESLGTATVADNGSYTIEPNVKDGNYVVRIVGTSGYAEATEEVTVSGADATAAKITLETPVVETTYTVSGTVDASNVSGVSVQGITVTLTPATGTDADTQADITATTDTDGAFAFSGVAAGKYKAVVAASAGNYDASESDEFEVVNQNLENITITLVAPSTDPSAAATNDVAIDADGTVTGTITVTLTNDTFKGTEGADARNYTVTVGSSNAPLTVSSVTLSNADGDASGDNDKAELSITWDDATVAAGDTITVTIDAAALTNSQQDLTATTKIATPAAESSDASLNTVLGQAINATGDGAAAATAKTASITVPNATEKVVVGDIEAADAEASVALYSNATFEAVAADGITLSAETTHAYIKVTAEDGTVCYYDVTITKEAPATIESATIDVAGLTVTVTAPTSSENGKLTLTGTIKKPAADDTYTLTYITSAGTEGTESVSFAASGSTWSMDDIELDGNTYELVASGVAYLADYVDVGSAAPSTGLDENNTIADAAKNELESTILDEGGIDVDNDENFITDAAYAELASKVSDDAIKDALNLGDKTVSEYLVGEGFDRIDAVVYLDVKVTDYVATAGSEELILNISPMWKYQLIDEEDSTKNKDIEDGSGAPVGGSMQAKDFGSIDIVVKLPDSLKALNNIYAHHTHDTDKYVYTVTKSMDGATGTFTNPNGFSEFVLNGNGPVAKIGEVGYETLKEAVANAVNDTVITVIGDASDETGIAVPDGAKTFTITSEDASNLPAATVFTATTAASWEVTATASNEGKTITVVVAAKGTVDPGPDDNNPNPGPIGGGGGGGGSVSSNVTVSNASNGKVTVTPTAPSKGATVTINLTPDTGYQVGTVTVTDKDGNTVELTKVNDTQYTFTMPDGKVTVNATFTQTQTPSNEPFVDVSASDYFHDAVLWAVEKGITNGTGANTFSPNNSCTRAQMVTFLWRAAGSPAPTGTNSFNDVAAGEYYTDAVLWAVEKGITNGTGVGTFSPNDTVTRGQTVTFLYRYAGSPAVTGDSSFTDVAAGEFYADAVTWAVAEGITNGTGANTFSPANDCTRGQIVTFMYRQMAE